MVAMVTTVQLLLFLLENHLDLEVLSSWGFGVLSWFKALVKLQMFSVGERWTAAAAGQVRSDVQEEATLL